MERELRKHISLDRAPDLAEHVNSSIIKNEDVQFFWTSSVQTGTKEILLEMVVRQWVKFRGFSVASAWVEKDKAAHKTTTQKLKGVRKQLLPKPKSKAITNSPAPQDQNVDPELYIQPYHMTRALFMSHY